MSRRLELMLRDFGGDEKSSVEDERKKEVVWKFVGADQCSLSRWNRVHPRGSNSESGRRDWSE